MTIQDDHKFIFVAMNDLLTIECSCGWTYDVLEIFPPGFNVEDADAVMITITNTHIQEVRKADEQRTNEQVHPFID